MVSCHSADDALPVVSLMFKGSRSSTVFTARSAIKVRIGREHSSLLPDNLNHFAGRQLPKSLLANKSGTAPKALGLQSRNIVEDRLTWVITLIHETSGTKDKANRKRTLRRLVNRFIAAMWPKG